MWWVISRVETPNWESYRPCLEHWRSHPALRSWLAHAWRRLDESGITRWFQTLLAFWRWHVPSLRPEFYQSPWNYLRQDKVQIRKRKYRVLDLWASSWINPGQAAHIRLSNWRERRRWDWLHDPAWPYHWHDISLLGSAELRGLNRWDLWDQQWVYRDRESHHQPDGDGKRAKRPWRKTFTAFD